MVNAWQFRDSKDQFGSALDGLYKISRIQQPTDTIYLADNESAPWRPIFTGVTVIGSYDLNDVWMPSHLPYTSTAPTAKPSGDRRVAAARHGQGSNLLLFDSHVDWKNARRIKIDDWREQK